MLAAILTLCCTVSSFAQSTRQPISMKDLEELSFVEVDDGLQGPSLQNLVSTTFEVDKGLSAPKQTIQMYDDQEVAKKIVDIIQIPQELHRVVKTSFEGKRLSYMGQDNFFKCIVQAYADHRSLVLSPDMVWLIISQGFSRYVNAHPEDMRDLLVSHEGKMKLVVNSDNNVLLPSGDWKRLLNDFSACVAANTKGELADLMTANFTTTGITERIASQISLMEVVKEYFHYSNIAGICGIPSIELRGTPSDWQKVLDKVRGLKKYNLEKWAGDLEVILKEFVEASKGNPNQKFWRDIVKKLPVDELTTQRSCLPDASKTTPLDGWFLKFFPNSEGETSERVLWNSDMPQEMVRVGFEQILTDPASGEVVMTIPMELWAGFVGIEENTTTHALKPKIGWLARISDEEAEDLARMKEQQRHGGGLYFNLYDDMKVPEILSKMEYIRSLNLNFLNAPVDIPAWLDDIQIDKFTISGVLTDEEEAQLYQRFPKVTIKRTKKQEQEQQSTAKKTKKEKAVKAGDKISGTVSDEAGPLMAATVCEIDVNGRIVNSAITDINGHFTMKVRNPQDRLRFSYVGMRTVMHAINQTNFKIVMESATHIVDVPVKSKRRFTGEGLPIPQREIVNAPKNFSMSEFEGLEIGDEEEGVPNENNPRVQISLTDEEQNLVMSVNDLGFNMFRKVGTNESILLSPLGMTYALGLINNGAAGKTRTQINKVLGCNDMGADKVNSFCRKMLTEAPRIDKLTTLEITNEFFSPNSYKLKSAFKEVAIDKYDTQFNEMESDQLKYTLVNTIFFKGVWTDKFRKSNTRDEVFKGEDGKENTLPMMNQTRQFFYTENDLSQALCLPYSNGAYQMIVLLPKEGKTVQEVAQSLTADSWEKFYDQMRRVDVDVKLPRFESSSEVNLTGVMSALGMPNAFSMEKADFRNLFDLQSCIKMIMQKGRIKVDETGTEATVATILQGRIAGLDLVPPQTIRFHATHPFLYFIREWSTGTIFFIGQYMGT